MSKRPASALRGGRQIQLHGYEVIVHVERISGDRHLCFAFLTDPFDPRHELKIFKGRGSTAEGAEEATLRDTLAYLDGPRAEHVSSILAGRNTLDVAGRKVDIFCDIVADGVFQAFPFLYRPDGSRVLILRFHLEESITGATPAQAISECIRRLEDHFSRSDSSPGTTGGGAPN